MDYYNFVYDFPYFIIEFPYFICNANFFLLSLQPKSFHDPLLYSF